jgi:hypothetical protein
MSNSLRLLAAVTLCFLCACHSKEQRLHVDTDEGPPRLASVIPMSAEKLGVQLVDGFYAPEGKSWRWTAGHFSVQLGTPPGANTNGAVLKLAVSIPQPLIDRVKTTTLTAEINGTRLSPETFTQPGTFTFVRDVPAKLLDDDSVRVNFTLDRFLPAGAIDARELGLVVTSVGFQPRESSPVTP